jgi:predicted O-methyltransferase YrrM
MGKVSDRLKKELVDSGQFSNIWFHRDQKPIWDSELKTKEIIESTHRYLEIGVCEGASMQWVFENLEPDVAVGIDPYIDGKNKGLSKTYKGNMESNLFQWRDQIQIFEHRSQTFLKQGHPALLAPFDLIYVDGDHEAIAAMEDLVLSWPLLNFGGIMIIDDYHRRYRAGRPKCREATDAFLSAYEKNYHYVWRSDRQIAIRKVKQRRVKGVKPTLVQRYLHEDG